jgi:hypothetical protein
MTGRIIVLALALLTLAACAGPPGPVADTACEWVKPILVDKDDRLTANTAVEILAHNDKWSRNCPREAGAK